MNDKTILFVEDNRDDEALTLRALKGNSISIKVDVARDGTEALDDLPGSRNSLPALVLLELDRINPCQIRANNYGRRPLDCEQASEAVCQPGLYRRLLNESPPHRGV